MEIKRIFDLLDHYAELCPDKQDALAGKDNSTWKKYSTREFIDNSRHVSYGLMKLGVEKGDKIASITFNRPEWNFLDMGVQQTGAIHIPIYPTISDTDYAYILKHAEVKYVVVAGEDIYRRIKKIVAGIPEIKDVYTFTDLSGENTLDELMELGKANPQPEKLQKLKDSISTEDIVTLIYTSGTTGTPKG